jgi:glycosyltransferase involved in cell wall biosynthesis
MNRISVLVPVYQGAEVIGQAIENILGQTEPPFEIVVADDGSRDGLEERVAALRPRCLAAGVALVLAHDEKHQGRGAARNRAIRAASGELVAWFDVDDLWAAPKLACQRAAFDRESVACPSNRLLLTCDYLRYDSSRGSGQHMRPVASMGIDDVIAIHTRRHIQLQTILGSRQVFVDTPFDEELNRAEDFDFALRFAANGGRIVNPFPQGSPLVHYFRGIANFGKEGRLSNRRVVGKNAAIFAASHIDPAVFLEHKLYVGLGGPAAPRDPAYALPPGPVLRAIDTDDFGKHRARLERLSDGGVRVHLTPGSEAEFVAISDGGVEIARGVLRDATVMCHREIVGWFMAGARGFLVLPCRGKWFPTERLLIVRAPSGLISIAGSSSARPPKSEDAPAVSVS